MLIQYPEILKDTNSIDYMDVEVSDTNQPKLTFLFGQKNNTALLVMTTSHL